MREGEIVQLDTPERILRHPANDFVRNFIGENRLNVFNGINFPPLEEFMTKAITVRANRGLAESNKILNKHKVDSLIVVDKNNVFLGVASSWDIIKNYKNEDMIVKDVMKTDYAYITTDESLEKALTLIKESKKGYVLVVDKEHRVKGVVTNGSLVRLLVDEIAN